MRQTFFISGFKKPVKYQTFDRNVFFQKVAKVGLINSKYQFWLMNDEGNLSLRFRFTDMAKVEVNNSIQFSQCFSKLLEKFIVDQYIISKDLKSNDVFPI